MKIKTIATLAALILPLCVSAQSKVWEQVVFKKGDYGYDTFRIPALIQTKGGAVLAFAEGRKDGGGDSGDIDMVLRRSTDGGKTWGEPIVVWDDAENTCGNPSPVVDAQTGRVILVMTWNNGRDPEKKIHELTSLDTRRVFVTFSDDEGLTWSKPRQITAETKQPDWQWYATGPCHAIQLQKGEHKGRIVVACDHSHTGEGSFSHVIYSDDKGETWHMGQTNLKGGNESTVCELKNGDLLLNMRTSSSINRKEAGPYRMAAVSKDGGETFGEAYMEKGLPEPVCNASIINYTKRGRLTKSLLFTNPRNESKRLDVTVSRSDDSGRTWHEALKLTDKPSAYSDVLVFRNGDVAVFYERGDAKPYESIVYALIPSKVL